MDLPDTGAVFTLGKSHLTENHQSYFFVKNDPVKRLISGCSQSAVICESGRLFVWGENQFGQLGIDGSGGENGEDVVTKPTCVKALKGLGMKVIDVAFGMGWSTILTHTNDIFFTGRNIFNQVSNKDKNFMSSNIAGETFQITRRPFRLDEFTELIDQKAGESFQRLAAGNDHFVVLTSMGRLFDWGSNVENQLGLDEDVIPQPVEIIMDCQIIAFTCGPYSTILLTEKDQLFLTGQLNEFQFLRFTELVFSLPRERLIFMQISQGNEIFLVSENGNIFQSNESPRNENMTFHKFYDYGEDNGLVLKLLKGRSFFAALTKSRKLFTTFSESGHHLKTFREISKFKNLKILDFTTGDDHILVLGVPKSTKVTDNGMILNRTFLVTPMPDMNGNAASRGKLTSGVLNGHIEEEPLESPSKEGVSEIFDLESTVREFKPIAKLDSMKGKMREDFKEVKEEIEDEIKATNDAINEDIKETKEDIKKVVHEIKEIPHEVLKEVDSKGEDIKKVVDEIKEIPHEVLKEVDSKGEELKKEAKDTMERLLSSTSHNTKNEDKGPVISEKSGVQTVLNEDNKENAEKTLDLNENSKHLKTLTPGKLEKLELRHNSGAPKSEIPVKSATPGHAETTDKKLGDELVIPTPMHSESKIPTTTMHSESKISGFVAENPQTTGDNQNVLPRTTNETKTPHKNSEKIPSPPVLISKTPGKNSAKSIKFDEMSLKSVKSQDKLVRPQTPYPDGTPQTVKKMPGTAASEENLDQVSPNLTDSLENIDELTSLKSASDRRPSLKYTDRGLPKEKLEEISRKAGRTPFTSTIRRLELDENDPNMDEKLEIEIKSAAEDLEENEIRFINDGVDVTENIETVKSKFDNFEGKKKEQIEKVLLGEELDSISQRAMSGTKNMIQITQENILHTADSEINRQETALQDDIKQKREDDERTTASVNSNKTSGNPFETESNSSEHYPHSPHSRKPSAAPKVVPAEPKKRKVRAFIDDLKAKGKEMSCKSDNSVHVIEDGQPNRKLSTADDQITVVADGAAEVGGEGGGNKTSKVCTIL